jgi:hypothetical protein
MTGWFYWCTYVAWLFSADIRFPWFLMLLWSWGFIDQLWYQILTFSCMLFLPLSGTVCSCPFPAIFRSFPAVSLHFPAGSMKFRFGYGIRNRLEKHVSGYGDFPVRNTASKFLCFSGRFLREYVRILQERRRKGTVSCGFRPETDAGTILLGPHLTTLKSVLAGTISGSW